MVLLQEERNRLVQCERRVVVGEEPGRGLRRRRSEFREYPGKVAFWIYVKKFTGADNRVDHCGPQCRLQCGETLSPSGFDSIWLRQSSR